MDNIKAIPVVEKFYSDDSMWGVYLATFVSGEIEDKYINKYGQIQIVGNTPRMQIGCEYIISGNGSFNKKFKIDQIELNGVPKLQNLSDSEGQRKYMSAILTHNQADTIIKKYPNALQDILKGKRLDAEGMPYINQAQLDKMVVKVKEKYNLFELITLLEPLGVTGNKIGKIGSIFKNKEMLIAKPYDLIRIKGFGFKTVDNLALKLNSSLKISEERLYQYVKYCLLDIANNEGHTYVKVDKILKQIRKEYPELLELFDKMIENKTDLLLEDDILCLRFYKENAEQLYNHFKRISEGENIFKDYDKDKVEKSIKNTEAQQGFELTEEQKDSIYSIFNENIITIQGKSGAGKSSSLKGIIDIVKNIYENVEMKQVALAAKACRRMTEVTNYPAKTIHSLLEFKDGEFQKNFDDQLPFGVYILDEASMVNVKLFNDLIQAIPTNSKVILVFDNAQLPPIGAGAVSIDILQSKLFKHNYLKKVHRQAEKSGILTDCNKIREGVNPLQGENRSPITHGELQDMKYFIFNSNESIIEMGLKAFKSLYGTIDIMDIAIITPMNSASDICCDKLNAEIQDFVRKANKQEVHVAYKDNRKFYLGDKVIQFVNDYELGVVNGEQGVITDITKSDVIVKYDNNKYITYSKGEVLSNINLAYALTCHKMQGSESKYVIVLFSSSQYIMLERAWLYTAISRAKEKCLLACNYKGFSYCIQNDNTKKRDTLLSQIIQREEFLC